MSEIVTDTATGRVRGARRGGVLRFAGIPYGADTAGSGRFRPAEKPEPWAGVRDALEVGPNSPQIVRPGRTIGRTSEDCLRLNIWTPSPEGKRAVLVWLHGGGFGQGEPYTPVHDGSRLAEREDVVVVSVGHRLGLVGYLGLEHLVGDEYAGSSTAGMTDIVRALEWVRDSIAGFGGDPGRVTVFGHSGGGGKTATLLAMPSARGLFRGAGVHGGPPFGYRSPQTSAEAAERLLDRLGIPPSQARRLTEMPVQALLDAQTSLGATGLPGAAGMMFAPAIGTDEIPSDPIGALAAGAGAGVGLMAGTAVDEADYALLTNPHWEDPDYDIGDDELAERISQTVDDPSDGGEVVERYRADREGARRIDLLREIMSDQFLVRTRRLAEAKQAADGEPVHLYVSDANRTGRGGSYHGVQIPFLFDTVGAAPAHSPLPASRENEQLAARVSRAHAAFARSGDPAASGDDWPAFGEPDRAHLVFGDSGWHVLSDPYRDRLDRWRGVPVTPRSDPWARLFA